MRREILLGTVFAACLAVGLGAQSTTSQSQSTSTPPQTAATSAQADQSMAQSTSIDQNDITLAGCVQSASAMGTTGTTGSTATPASSNNFTLSDVELVSKTGAASPSSSAYGSNTASSSSTASQSSQSMTGTSGATATGLMVEGTNLDKYVGKRVQVKGTLDNPGSWTASSGIAPTSGTFHVTSVKSLGGSCSTGR